MTTGDPARIERACQRLRGSLVRTPILGEPLLVGEGVITGLRLKLEALQCGRSAFFRGAMHALACRLGSLPVLSCDGPPELLLAWASAARLQRVPCLVRGACDAATWRQLSDLGARQGDAGSGSAMGLDDADFADGIATLGSELAAELPLDVEEIHLDARLARDVERGMCAAGRLVSVVAVTPGATTSRSALRRAVLRGVGLALSPPSLAVLASALRRRGHTIAAVV